MQHAFQHGRNFIGYTAVVVEQGSELISLFCKQTSGAVAGQTWRDGHWALLVVQK